MRPTRHRYGDRRCQVGHLWMPAGAGATPVPVVVLIHGGYWRATYTRAVMARLARAITERGWATWNIEYRRLGLFGGSGGWPSTLADVSAAVDQVTRLDEVDARRHPGVGQSLRQDPGVHAWHLVADATAPRDPEVVPAAS